MYFPLFLDLSQKEILVVGAGRIACRRIHTLYGFAGHIAVVAPHIPEKLHIKSLISCDHKYSSRDRIKEMPVESDGYAERNITRISTIERCFEEADLDGKDLVLAATDDAILNCKIHDLCHERGIPVNVCSDAGLCDFQFPSIVEAGSVVIGINAGGKNHALVKETRRQIEQLFETKDFQSKYS
ncbi:MAG: bifunctional precorrin-2 dehydrogenase/sirohydrochlorin ferrochelatase [Clostridiales bacterium]|nr:bifunctional precorrin-2 dehydrogenase/sirohydrochlorin ferrochelatase [Clostridiales bacterium]